MAADQWSSPDSGARSTEFSKYYGVNIDVEWNYMENI